jgi:uncharacterized membrane protein YoaK (UPF0700 family)
MPPVDERKVRDVTSSDARVRRDVPNRRRATERGGAHGRLAVVLMLALTFSTGMIDAIGFLGLDKVFTGNMTGNVVIIGMALAGADGIPLVGPALALAGFMAGAAACGVALRRAPTGWTPTTTIAFAVTGLACVGAGVVTMVLGAPLGGVWALSITAVLGAAMGLQAAAARALAVADLTTVVITSTIVGLSADQFVPHQRTRQGRRAAAIGVMLLGACCGSLALRINLGVALLLTGAIPLGVALVATVLRFHRPGTNTSQV